MNQRRFVRINFFEMTMSFPLDLVWIQFCVGFVRIVVNPGSYTYKIRYHFHFWIGNSARRYSAEERIVTDSKRSERTHRKR